MNYSYFIGIDIGKKTFDASIVNLDEKELSYKQFKNSREGIISLLKWSKTAGCTTSDTLFCAENMGSYVALLSILSIDLGFKLSLACPLSIKKSLGIQRGKSDRIDSNRIALYALHNYRRMKLFTKPSSILVKIKSYLNIRSLYIKQKVSVIKLIEATEKNLPLSPVEDVLERLNKDLACICEKIVDIEKSIETLFTLDCEINKNYQLLKSITGIGTINASVLLTSTDNFTKFKTSRQYACYCGIAPFEHTSGISIRGKTKTSNIANKEIKVFLTRAAITAMMHDPQMKAYYKRKLEEGKHKATIINAIRAKLISRCFAVIRRGTPFVKMAY